MADADLEVFLASLSRLRDLAMFLLMLDGGLRPGEVLSLQVDDISYGRRRVTVRKRDDHPRGVRGKSRAERVVDLHEPRTLEAVSRYMMHEHPLDATSPFVFLVGGNGKRRLEPREELRQPALHLPRAVVQPRAGRRETIFGLRRQEKWKDQLVPPGTPPAIGATIERWLNLRLQSTDRSASMRHARDAFRYLVRCARTCPPCWGWEWPAG
jgi:integrase